MSSRTDLHDDVVVDVTSSSVLDVAEIKVVVVVGAGRSFSSKNNMFSERRREGRDKVNREGGRER